MAASESRRPPAGEGARPAPETAFTGDEASESLRVSLGERSYEIRFCHGGAGQFGPWAQTAGLGKRAILISDANVEKPHAEAVAKSLTDAGVLVDLIVVEAGEAAKRVAIANELWEKLLDLQVDRQTAVVAVGGGVMGDLAGFVAATFARGLPFFQVPTTLLSQVDSSVGGKVGVNLEHGKNMVGAFWQPRGVMIDVGTLATLPKREYACGLAEVAKYGVIADADFFAFLESNAAALLARDTGVLTRVIRRSLEIKAAVVAQDEREETGARAILNYGHTFAHAFETLTGYDTLPHGEAVAIGMMCAARLASRLGRVDAALVDRQERLLKSLGLPIRTPDLLADDILRAMRRDKKAEGGLPRFILPARLGLVEIVSGVAESDVRASL